VSDAGEQKTLKLMIAIGVGAHLALIWVWPYPPILDWPNHMARHYLEALALRGTTLPAGYEISYSLMPNLGSDLIVPLLLQAFPLTVASRLFLSFNVLICWLGYALFVGGQAVKSGNAYGASVLVLPWLLTGPFFSGFLNYTSGIGLSFFAFSNYLRLFEKDRALPLQWVLQGMLIALLYVWHLAAFGTYLVLHGSHLLMHSMKHGPSITTDRAVRNKTLSGLAVLLPGGALVLTQKLTGTLTALDGGIVWHGAAGKMTTALASVLSYSLATDAVVIALWVAAVIAMLRIEALRRTQVDWLHVATFIFFILYIVLPSALGTTQAVDTRALAPFWICCIALIARLPGRRVIVGAAVTLIATLIRVGAVYFSWASFGTVHAQHLHFIEQLPTGARILAVGFPSVSRFNNDAHVIALAVPERQDMVSSLFAYDGQQPLRVTVNNLGPFVHFTHEGMEIDAERVRAASFDYLWCFNPGGRNVTVSADWPRVYSASSITVWRIR